MGLILEGLGVLFKHIFTFGNILGDLKLKPLMFNILDGFGRSGAGIFDVP